MQRQLVDMDLESVCDVSCLTSLRRHICWEFAGMVQFHHAEEVLGLLRQPLAEARSFCTSLHKQVNKQQPDCNA